MSPQELAQLVRDLNTAADVVDALENRELQIRRGWNLDGWRYRLIPWGVCFQHTAELDGACAEVVAQIDRRLFAAM
jgi:hypothetical protein